MNPAEKAVAEIVGSERRSVSLTRPRVQVATAR
jgi:hypothetical protein